MTLLVPLVPALPVLLGSDNLVGIDILTGFEDTDLISAAFPDYPTGDIDETQSFIEFTSHSEANFTQGQLDGVNDKVFFNGKVTVTSGHGELQFARSLLTNCDLTNITGVRLGIYATNNLTINCLGVRLVDQNWVYSHVDRNTLHEALVYPVSPDGNPATVSAFPTSTYDFPILWRSDVPSSEADPRPIDAHIHATFESGSLSTTGSNYNELELYFRELGLDYNQQLDLDNTEMGDLDGGLQPDYGVAQYRGRTQGDLEAENFDQAALGGLSQFTLERLTDEVSSAWLRVQLLWNGDGTEIHIGNSDGTPYDYPTLPVLDDIQDYALTVILREDSIRVQLHERSFDQLEEKIFDSNVIVDPGMIDRIKGRIGWRTDFKDGDAFLTGVLPRQLAFAEYRTQPFESHTPVTGMRLEAGASNDQELFRGIYVGPWGGDFTDFPERGPRAFRIQNPAVQPMQGVQSNEMYLDDFENIEVSFEILLNEEAFNARTVEAIMWNGAQPVQVPLTNLKSDAWTTVRVKLGDIMQDYLPGAWRLVLVQSVVGIPNDWFVNNVHITRRNVAWEGRAYIDDPWNPREEDWMPFDHMTGVAHKPDGILFRELSKKMQARGRAYRQNSIIDRVHVHPKYAEMGRFVWGTEASVNRAPIANFSDATLGLETTLTSTSSDPDGRIVYSRWTFGDGAKASGDSAVHTYEEAGTYPVTLTVTDNNGGRSSITQNVTVP